MAPYIAENFRTTTHILLDRNESFEAWASPGPAVHLIDTEFIYAAQIPWYASSPACIVSSNMANKQG
jgi:hypothetical protein